MSSRPPNILVPYEFALQIYLSRPGNNNPYVPMALDYFISKCKYILVMEYIGKGWATLSSYLKEKRRLDIETVRSIVRDIVNAMISLERHGIVHMDIHEWEKQKPFPSKSSNPPSIFSKYKAGIDELQSIWTLERLLYVILTKTSPYIDCSDYEKGLRKNSIP
ncbi:hypothetical protein BASA50_004661 [Batrachochytrium salamandrivorans]|uniref:non-specific serine/threonine protein kinase n=1 Tax=Batrachochytrium salamandrivorans TaxID=1357716 RepID=A0ABQ8FEY1_9FUNG|nr:hypothetical protein BASA50_004661 [Batrachochytrium salamandrivorans]